MIRPEDVDAEARAQLDWFRERFGHAPRHVDGHQHCHVWPATRTVLSALFAASGVSATRVPHEPDSSLPLCPVCSSVGEEAAATRGLFERHGLLATGAFAGLSLCGGEYTAEELFSAIQTQLAKHNTVEVMVHPGYREQGDAPWDGFSADPAREKEMAVLCGQELKDRLRGAGIGLAAYP